VNLACNRVLREERIHRRDRAAQVPPSQQQRYGGDFVAFVGHSALAEHTTALVAHQAD
jgi:hypothetical protein